MKRSDLEHAIRAACDLVNEDELVVIGSQAILAQYPAAPAELTCSKEVDVFSRKNASAADLIDAVLGERSHFDDTFGYYVHGVGAETAVLPDGWQDRLIPISNENTRYCTGLCLEAHDIAASKLVAGRPKDLDFVRVLLRLRMADVEELQRRIAMLPLPPDRREHITRVALRLAREASAEV